jgi:hypothetical protein
MSTLSLMTMILLSLQSAPAPQEPLPRKEDSKTRTFFEYINTAQGITLKVENGRVELKVPSEKGKSGAPDFATYTADSPDAFKRLYPDIARKYDLDRYLPKALNPEAVGKGWDLWAHRFGREDEERFLKDFNDLSQEDRDAFGTLDRWFDEEHQILRDLEHRLHVEGGPRLDQPSRDHEARFGVRVGLLGEALRQQLRLPPHQGLIVADVEKGSIAEIAGVKSYDVLLKLSGQPIKDIGEFRDQVKTALQSKDFTLDLIRAGSPLTLTIHPVHS